MLEEISFKEIFSILRRRLWLIILLLILFMLASGLVSYYVIDKKYEASTTLMIVTTDEIEYNEILLNQKLASIYSELIKTRAVANKVIENLKLRISYEQYKSKVKVNFVEDAGLIRIQVSDKNPKLAADIANEITLVFIEDVKRVMRVENIQVIDEAQVPTKPVSPKPVLNISIAGILGFMIGVFISFLKEYLDNTIKSYEDVEKYLELQVLGAIPKFKV